MKSVDSLSQAISEGDTPAPIRRRTRHTVRFSVASSSSHPGIAAAAASIAATGIAVAMAKVAAARAIAGPNTTVASAALSAALRRHSSHSSAGSRASRHDKLLDGLDAIVEVESGSDGGSDEEEAPRKRKPRRSVVPDEWPTTVEGWHNELQGARAKLKELVAALAEEDDVVGHFMRLSSVADGSRSPASNNGASDAALGAADAVALQLAEAMSLQVRAAACVL